MTTSACAGILLAGAAMLAACPANAQGRADTDPADPLIRPIVVTATKKAAPVDVQQAALAVSAFDGQALESRHVRDLSGLSYAIPGVSLDQVGTFRGVANWSIRGLGINSSIASIDPAVGTFVDGVYLGINPGAALETFDLASVEVLRGPQGTLYGRNTTGGAVLVNTADPARAWQVMVRASGEAPVGSGRGSPAMMMRGVVTGPVSESLAFRLGAYRSFDGGYFRNQLDGRPMGKADTTILRGGLLFENGALRLRGKAEYLSTSGDGAPGQNHGLFARDSFALSLDNRGFIRARSWLASLRADYDPGLGTITSIAGYRSYRQFTSNDIDATPAFLFHSKTGLTQAQWSDELRWTAALDDRLDLTAGGYIFHQNVAYDEDRNLPAVTTLTFYGGGRQRHDVHGLFASSGFAITPALKLEAGLRWSQEKKAAQVTFVRTRPACSVIAQTCPVSGTNPLITGESNGFADSRSWSQLSPRLGLSWALAPHVLAYASWTRGNRSGGYNLRIAQPAAFLANAAASGSPAFDAEKVDSFELGLKLQTRDGKGTLNLAAYRTDVAGMQREVSVANGGSGLAQSIYNTADARISGGEAEARLEIVPGLLLSANAAYIHARYTRVLFDISGDGSIGAADYALALPRVPEWTWGLGLIHRAALGGTSQIVTRINYQHRSRYAYTDNNFGWIGATGNLDGTIAWKLPAGGWTVSLYGHNMLDAVQFGGDTQIGFGAGPFSDGNNRPFDPAPAAGTFSPLVKGRVIGAEVALEF